MENRMMGYLLLLPFCPRLPSTVQFGSTSFSLSNLIDFGSPVAGIASMRWMDFRGAICVLLAFARTGMSTVLPRAFHATATCSPMDGESWSWMNNVQDQTPCLTAAFTIGPCASPGALFSKSQRAILTIRKITTWVP